MKWVLIVFGVFVAFMFVATVSVLSSLFRISDEGLYNDNNDNDLEDDYPETNENEYDDFSNGC